MCNFEGWQPHKRNSDNITFDNLSLWTICLSRLRYMYRLHHEGNTTTRLDSCICL